VPWNPIDGSRTEKVQPRNKKESLFHDPTLLSHTKQHHNTLYKLAPHQCDSLESRGGDRRIAGNNYMF